MVGLYEKRPETVRAVKFLPTEEQMPEVLRFIDGDVALKRDLLHIRIEGQGTFVALPGQWLVLDKDGKLKVMSDRGFQEVYRPA